MGYLIRSSLLAVLIIVRDMLILIIEDSVFLAFLRHWFLFDDHNRLLLHHFNTCLFANAECRENSFLKDVSLVTNIKEKHDGHYCCKYDANVYYLQE